MAAYHDLTDAQVTTRTAAKLTGLPRSTMTRARPVARVRAEPAAPVNKLSAVERLEVATVMNSARFVDSAPMEIFAQLLDEGTYLCSISTMYRILAENAQLVERRRIARHPARTVPELVATGPGQVYSWDITKLPGPDKGVYFNAYVMIDIYSRYIVGAKVYSHETGLLAKQMMAEIFDLHGQPEIVHADRGTSMTSKTVAELLADLDITRSHSRPKVSNDNPYSESWFKTLKYSAGFPDRFGSLHDARQFMDSFVEGYNHHHHHSGIGLHTPADVHYGLAAAKHADRQATLTAARQTHPERFGTTTSPKILNLPKAAWINQPPEQQQDQQAA